MCKAIEEMKRKGVEEGIEKGIQKGVELHTLESIKTIMKKLNYTAEQAMDFFDIPKKDFKKYMSML